jgi:membrane protease YdiL (CAAX protease family)
VQTNRIGFWAIAVFAAIYAAAIIYVDFRDLFPIEEALTIFVIVGVGLSLLAWLTTLGAKPAAIAMEAPMAQALLALILIAGLGAYLVYGKGWVDGLIPNAAAGGSDAGHQLGVLAGKLIVLVAIPYFAFRLFFGTRWDGFGLSRETWGRLFGRDGLTVLVLGAAFCAIQYFLGNGAAPIRSGEFAGPALWIGLTLSFFYLIVEVGLVEEFLFRGILQARLAAAFNSQIAGLLLMALLFGLVHAPGIALRGAGALEGFDGIPTLLEASAYTIAVQSIAALCLGVLWLRTKSLPAVMLVHAFADLFPQLPIFMSAFGLK